MKRITEVAAKLGFAEDDLESYGRYKAKISLKAIEKLKGKPNGKLVLVTAISPTPAGEGKTTTTVGLTDALNVIGKKAMMCLREPSLGPCFGVKGGAAGGGYAQVVPMEDINLHFTGDFHAITSAHNLLSALIDNHIYWGNSLGFDSRRVSWRCVLDMNDRARPGDASRIDAERVALMQMIVEHRREQRVRARDRVEVAGEMEVDVVHRDDLREPAARRAALHTEDRAEAWLANA